MENDQKLFFFIKLSIIVSQIILFSSFTRAQCITYTITTYAPTDNITGVNCITGANTYLFPGGLCGNCITQVCAVYGTLGGNGYNATIVGECLNNFNATINSTSTNICLGNLVQLYASLPSLQNGFSYQWYKNGTPISGATIWVYYASEPGNYYCKICNNWYSQQCKNSNTITLVSSSPVMTNANSINVCSGEILNFPLSSNIPSSYSWIAAESLNIGGENVNTTYSSVIIDTLENYTTLAQTIAYTVTPTANGCTGNSQLVTINVKPKPAILNTNEAQICSESNLNIPLISNFPSVFTWSTSNNQNVAPGSPSAGGNSNINTVLVNNTNENLFVTFNITPFANGCVGSSGNLNVLVFPLPEVSISPAFTTFCDGGFVEILANSTSPVSYQWKLNSNEIPNANSSILTSYNSGEFQVTVSDLNGCLNQSNIASVSTVPDPYISSQPLTEQTICVGGSIEPLTVTVSGGIGPPTFQWIIFESIDSIIPGANSSVFNPGQTENPMQSMYYATVHFAGAGCDALNTEISQINIVNDPIINISNILPQIVCASNNGVTFEVNTSGGHELDYQWFVNVNNSTIGGSPIPGATNEIFSTLPANPGVKHFYCQVSSPVSGCGAPLVSSIFPLTIISQPQFNSPSYHIGTCLNNEIPPFQISGNHDDVANYSFFQSNTFQNYDGFELDTNPFVANNNIAGIYSYYFTYSIDYPGCITDTSYFYPVTISETPNINLISSDHFTGCEGAIFNMSNTIESNLTQNFITIWELDNSISDTLYNSLNFQTTPMTLGSHQLRLKIISSLDYCMATDSVYLNLDVTHTPQIIEELNFDQNICPYDTELKFPSVVLSYDSSYLSPIYQWYNVSDNNSAPIPFANTNSYLPPIQNSSSYQSLCQIDFALPGCPILESSISEISADYTNGLCFPLINIPEAISPDNDGVNDYWTIVGLELFNGYEINIFNSFGQSIYFVKNTPPNWDGTWNGRNLPNGDYFYSVKLDELNRTLFGTISVQK